MNVKTYLLHDFIAPTSHTHNGFLVDYWSGSFIIGHNHNHNHNQSSSSYIVVIIDVDYDDDDDDDDINTMISDRGGTRYEKLGGRKIFGRNAPEIFFQLPSHYSSLPGPLIGGHMPLLSPTLRPCML